MRIELAAALVMVALADVGSAPPGLRAVSPSEPPTGAIALAPSPKAPAPVPSERPSGTEKETRVPAALPNGWDTSIPLPPGAVVSRVEPPAGVVQAVEFTAPGDFEGLVRFYEDRLPKAGFTLGPRVKVAARKAYSLNFSKGTLQDNLSVSPNANDAARCEIRVAYEPASAGARRTLRDRWRSRWRLARAGLRERWRLWPKWWRRGDEKR